MQEEEIWIGAPAAGESAEMDQTLENDKLAAACVYRELDQTSHETFFFLMQFVREPFVT